MPVGNGATFLLGRFVNVLSYLQIRGCRVLRETVEEIRVGIDDTSWCHSLLEALEGGLYKKG